MVGTGPRAQANPSADGPLRDGGPRDACFRIRLEPICNTRFDERSAHRIRQDGLNSTVVSADKQNECFWRVDITQPMENFTRSLVSRVRSSLMKSARQRRAKEGSPRHQPWVCEPSLSPVPSPARAGEGCPDLRDGVRAPSPRAGALGYDLPPLAGLRKDRLHEKDSLSELLTQDTRNDFDSEAMEPRVSFCRTAE